MRNNWLCHLIRLQDREQTIHRRQILTASWNDGPIDCCFEDVLAKVDDIIFGWISKIVRNLRKTIYRVVRIIRYFCKLWTIGEWFLGAKSWKHDLARSTRRTERVRYRHRSLWKRCVRPAKGDNAGVEAEGMAAPRSARHKSRSTLQRFRHWKKSAKTTHTVRL